jgi:transcriptional regulator
LDKLEQALLLMTPTQRKYVKLELSGWTHQKIAEHFGVSRPNISITICRAKKRAKNKNILS